MSEDEAATPVAQEEAAASGCYVVTQNDAGQDVVTLSHSSGAQATIYRYGATVTDFTTASGRQLLWTSSKAKLDGTKAIRGGIPLAFPQFGQPNKAMAQHGFARTSVWEIVEGPNDQIDLPEIDNPAICAFRLTQEIATHEAWPFPYEVEYTVAIGAEKMVNIFSVRNTGDEPFTFQCLIHTYFNIEDIEVASVTGFQGALMYDKVGPTPDDSEPDGHQQILIGENVDRIYVPRDDEPLEDPCVIYTPSGNIAVGREAVSVDADGNTTAVAPDTVVWNPWIAKAEAMADFEEGGWQRMLCVEPGLVEGGGKICEPQAGYSLKQVIEGR